MTEPVSEGERGCSPLPWIASTAYSSVVGVPVVNQQGNRICNTANLLPGEDQARALANAALIVEAVNSHARLSAENAELRKVLEAAQSEVSRVAPAVENLARHQEQCDMDGVMVKVSRQALDEALSTIEFVNSTARAALSKAKGE